MSAAADDLEVLDDLLHDLAKYLRQPLAYLPRDASQEQVEDAIDRALDETRKGPTGIVDAATLWQQHAARLSSETKSHPSFDEVRKAVEAALHWRDAARPRSRSEVSADFDSVGDALSDLIDELEPSE